ncbi:MAG: RsmB/NOP family class I SAM-dependent RNA methyltransferase [Planctomycetes bacterium]|nr:RsmB/NOP family class I SAM-dependent RNA methyltransferase [Planctomycetota bacterium]
MAVHERLSRAPATARARVSSLANAAVAQAIRSEFLLAGDDGFRNLPAVACAEALVLAVAVANGDWHEADAMAAFAALHRRSLAFENMAPDRAAAALATIVDPTERIAREYALPRWFAESLRREYGDAAVPIAAALLAPPPRTLRANLLRVHDRDRLARELGAEGVRTRPASYAATALHVDGDVDLFATAAFRRGAFEQQDEASQLAVAAVAPPPGGKVLDVCAGAGGKALGIAALLQNRGTVLAADVHAGRLQSLVERKARAGADNVQVAAVGEREWPAEVQAFAAVADRILVDAPCSGTGSWRRRPEARHAMRPDRLAALQATQDDLLTRAAALLRPGARLCYATCSLLADENERRIEALRARDPSLEPVRLVEILGGAVARPIADATGTFLSLRPDTHGCDGFFLAVLRRRAGKP